ncbi:hypothetical protein ACFU96_02295 [Streptomyces sp. NPDC057620]|uniref:hypothetical protein n=1 Tax=Streptomyces sp. NPDC057620 TaxID=3346185 RepID=UPI0036C5546D
MVPEWLSMLTAAGSAALVDAASTDAWQAARERFARLLGRGDPDRTEAAARRLDELRRVADLPGNERELADARHAWRLRLQDLLEDHPDAVGDLRSAIAELPPPRTASAAMNRQENRAHDHGTVNAVLNGDLTIHRTRPAASDG